MSVQLLFSRKGKRSILLAIQLYVVGIMFSVVVTQKLRQLSQLCSKLCYWVLYNKPELAVWSYFFDCKSHHKSFLMICLCQYLDFIGTISRSVQLSYSQCCVRKTSIVLMGLKGAFLTAEPLVENKQMIGNLSEIQECLDQHKFLCFILASGWRYYSLDLIRSQQNTWIC